MFAKLRVCSVLLILLTACTSVTNTASPDMSTTVPVQATAPPSAVPPDTASPTQAQPPANPTATEPVVEIPTSVPDQSLAGFRDQFATADQFFLNMAGMPAAPQGQVYQGWLVSDDNAAISLGVLQPTADGSLAFEWTSPNGENLLTRYGLFQITLEPSGGSSTPNGSVAYQGRLDSVALETARRLFVRNDGEPVTPLNTPFAVGLLAQADIAVQHVQNASNAAAIGALPETRIHLEHVINILEGAAGPRFMDYTGDGAAQNPGDGFGVVGYAETIGALLDSPEVAALVTETNASITAIQDQCAATILVEDLATVQTAIAALSTAIESLRSETITNLYLLAQGQVVFQVLPQP